MTTRPTSAVEAILTLLGPLFTDADDATASVLLEAVEEADSRITALERRRAFRVLDGEDVA